VIPALLATRFLLLLALLAAAALVVWTASARD
jgi:hypothetical protein